MSNKPEQRFRTRTLKDDRTECIRHHINWYNYYDPPNDGCAYTQGKAVTVYDSSYAFHRITEEMTDYVVPRFRTRSAKGEIFNNPLQKVTREVYVSQSDWLENKLWKWICENNCVNITNPAPQIRGEQWVGKLSASVIFGDPSGYASKSIPDIDISRLKDLALTQAHSNINLSEATLLVTAGEFKETVGSLSSIMRRVIRILRAVRRADLGYIRKELSWKALSQRYMEFRYALRPLFYEARGIADALKGSAKDIDRFTFRGYQKAEEELTPEYATWQIGPNLQVDHVTSSKRTVEVRSGVLTEAGNVSSLSIWGMDRPIEAAWELIPFSFVADWFANLGESIAAFTPNFGVKNLASWTVVKDEIVHSKRVTDSRSLISPTEYPYSSAASLSNCEVYYKQTTVTRTPNPQLSFRPHLKLRLDGFKLLDLAIIFKGLARRLNTIKKR